MKPFYAHKHWKGKKRDQKRYFAIQFFILLVLTLASNNLDASTTAMLNMHKVKLFGNVGRRTRGRKKPQTKIVCIKYIDTYIFDIRI